MGEEKTLSQKIQEIQDKIQIERTLIKEEKDFLDKKQKKNREYIRELKSDLIILKKYLENKENKQ